LRVCRHRDSDFSARLRERTDDRTHFVRRDTSAHANRDPAAFEWQQVVRMAVVHGGGESEMNAMRQAELAILRAPSETEVQDRKPQRCTL
jgi:hypothetical protein